MQEDVLRHLGYFPFCVGHEPQFIYPFFGGGVAGYPAVLKMTLKDAMALYWKSKKARLYFNFEYSGFLEELDPDAFPIGRVPQTFTLSVDEELSFYTTDSKKNESMKERVCFDQDSNEPLLTFSAPVNGGGILSVYLSFFSDLFFGLASPVTNRVFLDTAKPRRSDPSALTGSPDQEVYVNLFFVVTHLGSPAYSNYFAAQGPHTIPEISGASAPNFLLPRKHGLLKITINGTTYDVQLILYGAPITDLPGTIYNVDILNENAL